MPRIRKVEIKHFRGIQNLNWYPAPGINCLIGPGDSGKSTILDAIDLCLSVRRNIQFTDADFYQMNIEKPIDISVTLGELDDSLKVLEDYGLYVRGFNSQSGEIEDEPEKDAETVLTVRLTVSSDLEPSWSLVSERATTQGFDRDLSWKDRVRLAPTRIGVMANYHLGWQRGSVLNSVSEERPDASAALVKAARDARAAFAEDARNQLGETLDIVATTGKELGIAIGNNIKAMLDAQSVSFNGGTISLHDEHGIPLRGLGVGSTRLLVAGLQRKAAVQSTVILIDELEYGLEPHRIIRLLGSLGAKEKDLPLQVFMTTHSPVVLQELNGDQLFVTRANDDFHVIQVVGNENDIQGTIRSYPFAFLALSVIICEGASEVGFVRGLDLFRTSNGCKSISAKGVALVNSDGGEADRPFARASAFCTLGYRTAIIRDDDKKPTAEVEAEYIARGGTVIAWRDGRALEDELFLSSSVDAVNKLIDRAIDLHGKEKIDEHIKSVSQNKFNLDTIRTGIDEESRIVLSNAAKTKKNSWFKTITWFEDISREIVGPDLANTDPGFRALVRNIFSWVNNVGE